MEVDDGLQLPDSILALPGQPGSCRFLRPTFAKHLTKGRKPYWGPVVETGNKDLDIREIKEIRPGKNSRDFERYPEDARKLDSALCFVILYGMDFRLKTLSVAAFCEDDVNLWVAGLNWLVTDTQRAPTPLYIERWLRKQFDSMDRSREGR
ncbi:hypothetical protein JD844_015425 [Phrynosoma platyrhinos]|uniref:Uncharacterized protein n=1 Tax=Phrynosoma platyrhinos TaxID=52577 RepID=A0ABQ7SJ60_PHRPL|nr:hypothetical protein JD844_015425 [Phrynosoma platyrhinos]